MAKTRSLPDKFYDKDYEHNGIHRVPLWRIAGYALNNTATNVYLMMMNYATYYLMGWVGVGMMVASSLTMMMRIWDGVTDPFVGFMVDKTNSKFGKNRPFIVIGNIILCVTSYIAFHVTHKLPQGVRFPFYVVVLMVYYLGYTCQCVVTKSAQSCLTNDPEQRPYFTIFLGWCGAHRFLEHRWKLGIFYLLVGWTGLGLAFALVDLLIALPIAKDENGMIEI